MFWVLSLTIAAARYWGESVEDFIAGAIEGSIRATIDKHHGETGEWLALAKYEAAALKSDMRDRCESLRWLDTQKTKAATPE